MYNIEYIHIVLYYRDVDSETLCTEMRSLGITINREDQIITRLEIHHHMYPHLPALSDSPDRLSTVGDPSCMVGMAAGAKRDRP